MPGIFQQQVSGGDSQYASQAGVQNDSASKLVGFVGGQAIEANRGYNEAKFEDSAKEEIQGRLSNAFIQYASGENTELSALGSELQKFQSASEQGAMTNSQLMVRVENARRKAINLMPGRINEINALSQQTLGQYSAVLDEVDAQEKARSTQNAWADKQFRTGAITTGVPRDVALYQPIASILANPEYKELLATDAKAKQYEQMASIAKNTNTLDKDSAMEAGSHFAVQLSGGMPGSILNVASTITGTNVTDLRSLTVEQKAEVQAQTTKFYTEETNKYKAALSSSGWTGWDKRSEDIMTQHKAEMDYMNGIAEKEVYEASSTVAIAKAKAQLTSSPSNALAMVSIEALGRGGIMPQEMRSLSQPLIKSAVQYVQGGGANVFNDPPAVDGAMEINKSIAKNPNATPESKAQVDAWVSNLANGGVQAITDAQSLANVLSNLADPTMTNLYTQSQGGVSKILDHIANTQGSKLIVHMQANNLAVKESGKGYVFVDKDDGEVSTKTTNLWSPILNKMGYINDSVASSANYSRFMEILGLDNTNTDQGGDSTTKKKVKISDDKREKLMVNLDKAVTDIVENESISNERKNELIKGQIDTFQGLGLEIRGEGSYAK